MPERVPALCELRGVSQEFPQPRGKPRRILEGIDLAIFPEEVVALLGPSGCGKSTILRILTGLTRPTAGEVRYHGEPLAGLNPGVGFVFQSFALFPWMTVTENVEAVLLAHGLAPDEVHGRAARMIRLVGLSGSEAAYPRELSGGMKQRVGMARALSLEPELMFMDEPFSQVDALTAESLRAEIIDIWSARESNPRSLLMVSHDTREVAYMADRIIVLDANPGRIRTVVENRMPRPRDYRAPALLELVDRLHDVIAGMEMPDGAAPSPPAFEPLPDARASEIVGLVEYLDARGGREDVFRIAEDTDRSFDKAINVVNAAELLGLVDTPHRAVVLSPSGLRFVRAPRTERRAIWREHLLSVKIFQQVREATRRTGGGRLTREFVLELIAVALPLEDYEAVFERFVSWSRYGDLFAYDDATETLSPR
jgi:NitT/TauT family transport system ATP-binding protein